MPETPDTGIDPAGITWTRVSPRLATLRALTWSAGSIVVLAVTLVPGVLRALGAWEPAWWFAWLPPAVVLLVSLWRLALIRRQVRALGYAERRDDLLLRRGIFFQRTLVVPYGRMQYVDVGVGPLERAFGLSTVILHTANPATQAHLPGLPTDEAARLREQLSSRGEARLAGL